MMIFRRIVGRTFLYHEKCEKVEQFLVLNEKVQGGGTIFGETISVTPVLLHAQKYLSIYAIKVVIKYYNNCIFSKKTVLRFVSGFSSFFGHLELSLLKLN